MVINGRKIIIGMIIISGLILSYLAFNRIVEEARTPAAQVSRSQPVTLAAGESPVNGFFAEHRLLRERNRSRQIELLEKIVNNDRVDSKSKSRAAQELIDLTDLAERERVAEETVKAMGYQDCVVLIRDHAALAVVAASRLTPEEERQIARQLADIVKVGSNQITVMSRPGKKQ